MENDDAMKTNINTKKLGKKQIIVLHRMINEQLVIRSVKDAHDMSEDINLQDEEGDNDYEKITPEFLNSLYNRGLFEITSWMPALHIDITTFRIKKTILPLLKTELCQK